MKTIEIIWSTDDVMMQADIMNIDLTEEQADAILENVLHYHDASVGINWDVLDFHIENYFESKNNSTKFKRK
jgi:hypothetical protein